MSSPTESADDGEKKIVLEVVDQGDTLFVMSALKWYGGAAAAVSITYDAVWGTDPNHRRATDAAIARGLRMDLEIVSAVFLEPRNSHWLEYYRDSLLPSGIHFFGHGHTHALHDTLGYAEAYSSFKTNFDHMEAWGLKPKVYAYPGSSGEKPSTQRANRDAGFIAARGSATNRKKVYIMPGNRSEPRNWSYLPSVVMGDEYGRYVDRHEKLSPVLERAIDRTAWVILMYHSIGIPDGWSYYPMDDFLLDLDQIQRSDFWSANFDAAVSYILERTHLQVDLVDDTSSADSRILTIRVSDGFPNDLYDQPLTMVIETVGPSPLRLLDIRSGASGSLPLVETLDGVQFDLLPNEEEYVVEFGR